jgi:hypothetical protein
MVMVLGAISVGHLVAGTMLPRGKRGLFGPI